MSTKVENFVLNGMQIGPFLMDYLKNLLRQIKWGFNSDGLLYCKPIFPSKDSVVPPASERMISPAAVSHSYVSDVRK